MYFLGIDLGWSSGASGLCCLAAQGDRLLLMDLQRVARQADILAWVERWLPVPKPGGVAVDAPTVIGNPTGMRLCDRLTHQYFGRYHGGSYPANLGRPFAAQTIAMGHSLENLGFHHAPEIAPRQPARFQIEVFPHPAMIQLFGLERILKYKKGPVSERRIELAKLRGYIHTRLPQLMPALDLAASPQSLPELPPPGKNLKVVEDQLDSVICAYVAAHWWFWGQEHNQTLGNLPEGYIIVPMPQSTD
jgi:predicted RNase H-like nuclease